MKAKYTTAFILLALVVAFTGCGDKKEDKNPEVIIHADEKMSAEELAESGEALVSPFTFMLADRVFTMALAKDPENKKAQFYKNFVKRLMVLKGIVRRIAPLARAGTAQQRADYEDWKKQFPESPLKTFLLDGPEDLTREAQLVDVLTDYQKALNDFRKFLKVNSNMELTLNLNPYVFEKDIKTDLANSCRSESSSDSSDSAGPGTGSGHVRGNGHGIGDGDGTPREIVVRCYSWGVAQKKVNAADLVAIRQMTGGEIYFMAMYTAYDISTFVEISKNQELKTMTPPEVLKYYKSLPSLGKLRKEQTLGMIPELGSDLSAAIKWAKQYQDRICPGGAGSSNQRPGFLFKDGLCVNPTQKDEQNLARLDHALAGIFSAPLYNSREEQIGEIRTNALGFFANPPQELKALLPESVDSKGQVTQWSDKTFGGLFPDGDIDRIPPN
jgi:tetratricopeptide (TPR) repeat protein